MSSFEVAFFHLHDAFEIHVCINHFSLVLLSSISMLYRSTSFFILSSIKDAVGS